MTSPLKVLRQPVRLRVVAHNVGRLAMVWATLVLVPMGIAYRTGEFMACGCYGAIAAITAAVGYALSRVHAPRRIQMNEAMVIASSLFILSPLAMSAPLVTMNIPIIDAYFESVSGVTTTGLSSVPSVESKSDLFLFVRSWTQWYGGLGVVALALALATQPGALARRLSLTESDHEDTLGGTQAHFRSTLTTYSVLTIGGIVALWLLGASGFHAVVYALAAVSTGGFAPHDANMAALNRVSLQAVVIALCVACALPLSIYARLVRGQWREAAADPQLRGLVWGGLMSTTLLSLSIYALDNKSLTMAATHGPMMALSAHTTAGFSSIDMTSLGPSGKLIMVFAMVVGGSAGSTAGGIKILRVLILAGTVRAMFARMKLPKHAVFEPRIGGRRIEKDETQEAVTIVALFLATVIVSWFAFVASGYDPLDSLFEVTSATGTVGLSTGITNQDLSPALKMVLCADMLLGRLELIALFVVLMPGTWIARRGRKP